MITFFRSKNKSETFFDEDLERARLPDDYVSIRTSPAFLSGFFGEHRRELLSQGGVSGVRYFWWIFAIEYYTGDKQPTLIPFRGIRFAVWDRVKSVEKPQHWYEPRIGGTIAPHAIVPLASETYWDTWSHGTKNHRTRLYAQSEYQIITSDIDTFLIHFKQHARPRYTVAPCNKMLIRQKKEYGDGMQFFLLQNTVTNIISAGIAVADYPDVGQAYYVASFYAREHIPRQAGVWLLNTWFMECKKKGMLYANLGTIYAPGQPKSWKGFSQFKMNFNPYIITCRKPLVRITTTF